MAANNVGKNLADSTKSVLDVFYLLVLFYFYFFKMELDSEISPRISV